MLRYNFKIDNDAIEKDIIPVDEINVLDMHSYDKKDSLLVNCHHSSNDIHDGGKIYARNVITLKNSESSYGNNSTYEFNEVLSVVSSNDVEHTFSFYINRYYKLEPTTISLTYIDNVPYVYFYFNDSHYFNKIDIDGNDIDISGHPYILFIPFSDSEGDRIMIPFDCQYITNSILRCKYDVTDDLLSSLISEIRNADNEFFEAVTIDDIKTLYSTIFNQTESDSIGDISNIEVYRKNFLYQSYGLTSDERYYNLTTDFYCDKPLLNLSLPFSSTFQTDIDEDANIAEYFVNSEKKKAINAIVDMEKDVYHPCFIMNNKFTLLKSIKFNLHFRKRGTDGNWETDDDSYWNGTYVNNGKVSLMDNVGDGVNSNGFFSYSDKSSQSDLLSYLDFTNNDVKYRKNKLKKSFLRLSFYDSMNASDQNLLAYYTIFYNTGNTFTKLMRHFEDDDYSYSTISVTDNHNTNKLNGIRVNREPYSTKGVVNDEDLRISSQFVVEDKYQSSNSSEGFYLYLWKDNDEGVIPSDIYLKVEFNHAGYGRSVPMMMPFVDPKKHNGNKGIKLFQDILDDFNGEGTDKPYGIRQYLKYSYIHLKYCYDKDSQTHLYYLDNNQYGDYGSRIKDNCLIINLYEAKISNKA